MKKSVARERSADQGLGDKWVGNNPRVHPRHSRGQVLLEAGVDVLGEKNHIEKTIIQPLPFIMWVNVDQ